MMIWVGLACFISAFFLTYGVRYFARQKQIMDTPNHRSLHKIPTPRGGGLAFVLVFYAALFILWLVHAVSFLTFMAFLGGILVALVGYLDDLIGLKSKWRFLAHILASVWGIAWLHGVLFLTLGSSYFYAPVLLTLGAVWLSTWLINLYNFMDGIDGLAGMEAVFLAGAAGVFLFFTGAQESALICMILAASVLGFLIWNWSPASIFMGDIGSGFLGYIFAILIWLTNKQHTLPVAAWLILLGVFLGDATCTLIYRMIQKKRWQEAHREHAYQRLTLSGYSHQKVVLGVLGFNIFLLLPLAFFYLHIYIWAMALLYLLGVLFMIWGAWFFIVYKFQAK